jgi:hypothetical protein
MMRTWVKVACGGAAALLLLAGCSNEISKSSSPVELVATNTQILHQIDIAPTATGCNQNVGTIELQSIVKNLNAQTGGGPVNTTFEQVHVTSYQVSYERADGGKLVPAPFTNPIDMLLTPGGGATSLSSFEILRTTALNQAPFAALLPQNGGRDPDTQQATIRMNIIVTVFGQTLAGDSLSASTRFPMAFCYQCGGCA